MNFPRVRLPRTAFGEAGSTAEALKRGTIGHKFTDLEEELT